MLFVCVENAPNPVRLKHENYFLPPFTNTAVICLDMYCFSVCVRVRVYVRVCAAMPFEAFGRSAKKAKNVQTNFLPAGLFGWQNA